MHTGHAAGLLQWGQVSGGRGKEERSGHGFLYCLLLSLFQLVNHIFGVVSLPEAAASVTCPMPPLAWTLVMAVPSSECLWVSAPCDPLSSPVPLDVFTQTHFWNHVSVDRYLVLLFFLQSCLLVFMVSGENLLCFFFKLFSPSYKISHVSPSFQKIPLSQNFNSLNVICLEVSACVCMCMHA